MSRRSVALVLALAISIGLGLLLARQARDETRGKAPSCTHALAGVHPGEPTPPVGKGPLPSVPVATAGVLSASDPNPLLACVGTDGISRRPVDPAAGPVRTAPFGGPAISPETCRLICGRVVDTRGQPVGGALVWLSSNKDVSQLDGLIRACHPRGSDQTLDEAGIASTTSAPDGSFSLRPSVELDYREPIGLVAWVRSDRDAYFGRRRERPKAVTDGRADVGDLTVRRQLRVTVLIRANGVSVSDAPVTLSWQSVGGPVSLGDRTDGDGRVSFFPDESDAPATLGVEGVQGFGTERRAVEVHDDVDLQCDLTPSAVVEGLVMDLRGHAVESARVRVIDRDLVGVDSDAVVCTARTTADGRFTLDCLRSGGLYEVGIAAETTPFMPGSVRVTAPAHNVALTLSPLATLVVEGRPVPGMDESQVQRALSSIRLEFLAMPGRTWKVSRSRGDVVPGAHEITFSLEPGVYRVASRSTAPCRDKGNGSSAEPSPPTSPPVTLASTEATRLAVALAPAGP